MSEMTSYLQGLLQFLLLMVDLLKTAGYLLEFEKNVLQVLIQQHGVMES